MYKVDPADTITCIINRVTNVVGDPIDVNGCVVMLYMNWITDALIRS
jgi:hypothetical protein